MEKNHKLGLYISYYLSRFDKNAYKNIGFGNKSETHIRIGQILNINSNTVRNWRDEFDPIFKKRAGWHQVLPRPAIKDVMAELDKLGEAEVGKIVLEILERKEDKVIDITPMMKKAQTSSSNELAIIVAYYLSRFNKTALENLGFKNHSKAFESISIKLGIKKNYIKFRRDDFNLEFTWRKGWQRPMDKRIINAIEILKDLSETELREIVLLILNNDDYRDSNEIKQITSLIHENADSKKIKNYTPRGPTGRKAEEYFKEHHKINQRPVIGELIDRRDFGEGYDFKIILDENEYYLEIKGILELEGGILFTGKEWDVAKQKGDSYFLIVISDLNNNPEIKFIQNPAKKLSPKMSIVRPIQTNWTVSKIEIEKALSK